jgi:FMN phosphatase YigB (HAD superfamily)
MLQALLLDLDNTLILYDEPSFYVHFFKAVQHWFDDLLPGDRLRAHLARAMISLKNGAGQKTNRDRFVAGFCENASLSESDFWDRYVKFYEIRYPDLPVNVTTPKGLTDVFHRIRDFNLTVVIATNPVFPLEAVHHRISWAGLDPLDFTLITHLDNMSYVKPQSGYYRQITEMIGLPAHRCLMVGNDPINDMAAGAIGMHTFLTTDGQTGHSASITDGNPANSPANRKWPKPEFTGRFAQIPDAVGRLMQEETSGPRESAIW